MNARQRRAEFDPFQEFQVCQTDKAFKLSTPVSLRELLFQPVFCEQKLAKGAK